MARNPILVRHATKQQKRGCLPCPPSKWFQQDVDGLPPIYLKCTLLSFTTTPPCRCVYDCGIAGKKDCAGTAI